jgi:hypothetical protein
MNIISFSCPECGRLLQCHPAEIIVRCSCGKSVAAAAAQFDAAPALKGRRKASLARLLIVIGAFTAIMLFAAFVGLSLLTLDRLVRGKADAATDGAGRPASRDELDDETDPASEVISGEGREPLRQAFDALGSRQKLDAIKAVQIRGKAHFSIAPNVNNVTLTWQSTHRFKYVESQGGTGLEIGFVLKGDEGTSWLHKFTRPMSQSQVNDQQLFAYSLSLSDLLPLKEKGYTLIKGKTIKIRDRDCYTITVKSPGRPNMVLSFDEETHLLAKSTFKARVLEGGFGQMGDIRFECYYSNYRESNGITHWWKFEQFRNGGPHGELNLEAIQFFDRADDHLFALPGS